MLKITDLLAEFDDRERRTLTGAIMEGIHRTRLAALSLLDEEEQGQEVVQLLTRLSTAIERLQAAREIVRRRA